MAFKHIDSAMEAWKLLDGILCIYKPAYYAHNSCATLLTSKLCNDLNSMKTRPPQTTVELRRRLASEEFPHEPGRKVVKTVPDGNEVIEIVQGLNYADHPNVIGPRYQPTDFRRSFPHRLPYRASGVNLIGLNHGTSIADKIQRSQWIRTFVVSAKFGIATKSCFDDGIVMEKSTYHKIDQYILNRTLASMETSHQRSMFRTAGIPLDSPRAYELASKGLVRPEGQSTPLFYSIKCIHFDLPHFELEIKAINETEEYLGSFIHELGLKLHSTACCTKLRCIQYGPFGIDHALLSKHWGVENVIGAMQDNSVILKDFNFKMRDPLIRPAAPGARPREPVDEAEITSIIPEELEEDRHNIEERVINYYKNDSHVRMSQPVEKLNTYHESNAR